MLPAEAILIQLKWSLLISSNSGVAGVNHKQGRIMSGLIEEVVIAGMLVCGISTTLLVHAEVLRSSNEDNGLK